MPDQEGLKIPVTVEYRIEKRRPIVDGRPATEAEIAAIEEGVEVAGLEYELYDTIVGEPETVYLSADQVDELRAQEGTS